MACNANSMQPQHVIYVAGMVVLLVGISIGCVGVVVYYEPVAVRGRLVDVRVVRSIGPSETFNVQQIYELPPPPAAAAPARKCYLTMGEEYDLRSTAEAGATSVVLGTTKFVHPATFPKCHSCVGRTDYLVLVITFSIVAAMVIPVTVQIVGIVGTMCCILFRNYRELPTAEETAAVELPPTIKGGGESSSSV